MKNLKIEVVINKDKVATVIKTNGYSNESISDQFELLGIIENIKGILNDRIKKFIDVKKG